MYNGNDFTMDEYWSLVHYCLRDCEINDGILTECTFTLDECTDCPCCRRLIILDSILFPGYAELYDEGGE